MALGKNKKGVFLPEKVLGASLPLRVLMVITKQFLGDSHPLVSPWKIPLRALLSGAWPLAQGLLASSAVVALLWRTCSSTPIAETDETILALCDNLITTDAGLPGWPNE